jgi:hypothetical protein
MYAVCSDLLSAYFSLCVCRVKPTSSFTFCGQRRGSIRCHLFSTSKTISIALTLEYRNRRSTVLHSKCDISLVMNTSISFVESAHWFRSAVHVQTYWAFELSFRCCAQIWRCWGEIPYAYLRILIIHWASASKAHDSFLRRSHCVVINYLQYRMCNNTHS